MQYVQQTFRLPVCAAGAASLGPCVRTCTCPFNVSELPGATLIRSRSANGLPPKKGKCSGGGSPVFISIVGLLLVVRSNEVY